MENLSKKITNYIIGLGVISKESYAIYQYGFQLGLEMFSCFIVSLFIAIYMNMIIEFLLSTIIFIFLRSYAGGIHMNSFIGCFICSISVQTLILLINSRYPMTIQVSWLVILLSVPIIVNFSPVESVNKELDECEKLYCKEKTMKILWGLVIFSFCLTLFNIYDIVSLIALTILVVLLTQFLGILKYNNQRNSG